MTSIRRTSVGAFAASILAVAALAPAARADGGPRSPDEVRRAVAQAPAWAEVRPDAVREGDATACAVTLCDTGCGARGARWFVTLGTWIWSVDGSASANGRDVDLDGDLSDLWDVVEEGDLAFTGRARAEWGRWSATVEYDGGTIDDSIEVEEEGEAVGGELALHVLQLQAGYHVAGGRQLDRLPPCSPCGPVTCIEAYAGARVWWADLSLDGTAATADDSVDVSETWVDPLVGVRVDVRVAPRWALLLEADVGGFGVGSDLSWNLLGAVSFYVSDHVALRVGWKAMGVDYDGSDLDLDATLNGPTFAVTFAF